MMIRILALCLLVTALMAAPVAAQVCDQSFTLRTTACPAGALDCTNKGSELTYSEGDANFVNLIDLCKPFDVTSTAVTVEGDWLFNGSLSTAATATPGVTFSDSNSVASPEDVNFRLYGNLTDTGDGTEDMDIWLAGQRAGAEVNHLTVDADGGITLGNAGNASLTVTTDSTGDAEVVLPAGSIGSGEISTIPATIQSMYWGAGAMIADGTNCADPAATAGYYIISCADGGSFVGSVVLPDSFDATADVNFEISASDATGSVTLAGDFGYQCFGNDDAMDATYETGAAADVTLTTANDLYNTTTTGIDVDTECDAGDLLRWRYLIDDATNTCTACAVLGVKMEGTWGGGD